MPWPKGQKYRPTNVAPLSVKPSLGVLQGRRKAHALGLHEDQCLAISIHPAPKEKMIADFTADWKNHGVGVESFDSMDDFLKRC